MPAVTRLGDSCTGHGCFPPRNSTGGSGTVFVNGIPVHREGDSWAAHCCGIPCHGGSLASGSSKVYVEGKQIGRVGDPVDCGSTVADGSQNVFSN